MKKTTKKNAFTLIELLAVIVILAIIALIAVPVILNIIDKANKSAFKDTAYGIISAGELYFAEQQLEVNGMQDEEVMFELPDITNTLGLKGNIPTGSITITRDGKISLMIKNDRYCVTKGLEEDDITITKEPENCTIPSGGSGNQGTGGSEQKTLTALAVDDFTVSNVNGSNTTVVTKPACLTDGTACAAGTPVAIKVNENETYRFFVLKDENNKVTLIMDRNLYAEGNTTEPDVAWISKTDYTTENNKDETPNLCSYASCNDEGPLTALNKLNERTSGWSNIPEMTYTLGGLAENGTKEYEDMTVTSKARLITYAEANAVGCTTDSGSCPAWMYVNLNGTGDNNTYGYWTSTAKSAANYAWRLYLDGRMYDYLVWNESFSGVRPVIELSK